MITDKEAVEAFEVLHDYCDERECKECIFRDDNKKYFYDCILKNCRLAFLRVEEEPILKYKIKRGEEE